MNKISWLMMTASTITLTSCISSGGSSSSEASSSSSAMSWGTGSFPLTLRASSDFSLANRELLNDMAVEWEDLGVQADASEDVNFFSASTGAAIASIADPDYANPDSYRDSTLGIYLLNTWPSDFSSSALAVTQLWGIRSGSGIRITHFDIFFNEDNYDFYTNPADAGMVANTYDMGTIALHELGHGLGLNHISNVAPADAVMYPYLGISTVKRTARDCDLKAISDNYGWDTDSALCPGSLTADNGQEAMTASLDAEGVEEGDDVGLLMEVRADGTCHHFVNKREIGSHTVKIK